MSKGVSQYSIDRSLECNITGGRRKTSRAGALGASQRRRGKSGAEQRTRVVDILNLSEMALFPLSCMCNFCEASTVNLSILPTACALLFF